MKTPTNANELTAALLLEIPKAVPGSRVWRCQVGGAYPIQAINAIRSILQRGDATGALALLSRTRPLTWGGIPGLPDIDGILPDGRRLGVEVKWGKDRQSDDQKVCQRIYEDRGAVYVVAKDLDGAMQDIRNKIPSL